MTDSKFLILALAIFLVDKIAGYTYHIAFLGREQSNSTSAVGEIHFKAFTPAPTISSMHSNCTDIDATLETVDGLHIGNFSHPDCVNVVPNGTEVAVSGIKVESSEEFFLHVYQMDDTGDLADGYLAIPDEYLGTEYFIGTYCSLGGTCQFAVTAVEDVTSVTIVFQSDINSSSICANSAPVSGTSSDGLGIPFTINEFDVLHIESRSDLSGTYIRADKKIGVIVGSRNVPANSGESSYMIEQIPPVSRLGTTFVVAPNHFNEAGDVVKIVAVADNTVVHVLGFSPFVIPRKGQHVERRVDWHVYSNIEASNPVLILQVMSVDLYNASDNVQGRPSMVLVPHTDQWTDKELFFHCLVKSQENASITFTDRTQCVFMPQYDGNVFQPKVAVGTTEYSVFIGKPTSDVTNVTCEEGVAYGYCRNRAAVLLGASWKQIQEDCQQTVPYPGDNKDNDCDGQIDEDTCTENDLQFNFHAEQYPNGTMIFKKISVANVRDPITFTVQTCDMAVILLRSTTTDVENTFTVYISPSSVTVCGLHCTETKRIVNCIERQDYQIAWRNNDTVTEHAFWINFTSPNPAFNFNITGEIRYTEMIISALAGSAEFTVKLPIKDCGKIVAGDEADNFGKDFVMPFYNDTEITIFLTASNNETRVEFSDGIPEQTVDSHTTKAVTVPSTVNAPSGVITMKAIGGEISVYVVFQWSQKVTAFSVLPTDVLGPSYHLYLDYDETSSNDDKLCNVFSEWGRTRTNLGTDMNQYFQVKVTDYKILPPNRLLKADRPVVVFCSPLDKSTMQIPPAESLGTHFYIPKLDLTGIKAKAEIRIIATEDSTVVIVMGDYDRLDTIDLTVNGGVNVTRRTMEPSYMYEINSTTPIQLMLKFTSVNDSLTVLHIPPVEQYKRRHVYPDLNDKYTVVERSAVDSTGNEVNTTEVNYTSATFALTVYKTSGSDHFIIASDVRLNDINKPCKVTAATAGDNKDNDCDGLIDEEVCPATIIPGEVDIDIDGSLNEDCAENGTVPQLSVTLDLPERNIACPSPGQNVTESNSDTTNTGSNQQKYDSNIIIGTQSTSPWPGVNLDIQTSPGSGPTYQTLEATRKTVPLSSTESPTNIANNTTQTETEETCTTDCVCPCGWVDEKNYTEAEIQKKVEEIQEKLRLTKDKLSASIRQKTSAPDDRPSATAVGFVGVAFLVAVLGTMVLLDITAIVRDLRTLLLNLREVFQH